MYVLYSAHSLGGFLAQFVARAVLGDIVTVPLRGKLDQLYKDTELIFMDYVPSRRVLRQLTADNCKIQVFDHHVARTGDICKGLDVKIHINPDKCAARQFLELHNKPVHYLVKYIEDQIFWRRDLPCTDEVDAFIASYPWTNEAWVEMFNTPFTSVLEAGRELLRNQDTYIQNCVDRSYTGNLAHHRVAVVNSAILQRKLARTLAAIDGVDIGCTWWYENGMYHYHLYTYVDDINLDLLLRPFKGGGTRNRVQFQHPRLLW